MGFHLLSIFNKKQCQGVGLIKFMYFINYGYYRNIFDVKQKVVRPGRRAKKAAAERGRSMDGKTA